MKSTFLNFFFKFKKEKAYDPFSTVSDQRRGALVILEVNAAAISGDMLGRKRSS